MKTKFQWGLCVAHGNHGNQDAPSPVWERPYVTVEHDTFTRGNNGGRDFLWCSPRCAAIGQFSQLNHH